MAMNFKKPSKKTAIITIVAVIILLAIAITGTVVFLRDRGTTEAADLETEQVDRQVSQDEQTPNTGVESESVQPEIPNEAAEQTDTQNQGTAEGTRTGTTANAGTTGTTANAGTTNARTTTGTNAGATRTQTGTTTDNIQETTITRTESIEIPERQVSEGHYVGWTPIDIEAELASAKINAKYDNLEIKKVAKTATGENLVTKGEEITYEISVKNNSEKELKGIEIKDKIPAMTEYKSGSIDNNGEEIKEATGKVIGLKWNIDLKAGEEKVVSFKVTVAQNATGTIENIAVVNGESTDPAKTAVVTASKTATIEGKEKGQPAKVGDKITYTITVVNTGDIAGKANVKDESLAKLVEDGILKIDEASKETATKVIEGTTIDVPAKGKGNISFTMVVEKINGAIKNIAIVGTEEQEATVDTVNITAEKANTDQDNVVKPGDTFDYTIVLTNNGNTTGSVTVTDDIPDALEITGTTPTATVTGNHVDFGNVEVAPGTPVTLTISVKVKATATGDIKNVGKVDGKDVEDPETIKTVNITAEKSNNEDDNKVKPGDTFDYTIVLTNSGNTTGSVTVTDEVPEGLKVTGTNPTTAKVEGRKVDFGNVEVAPGEANKVTLTISVEVEATATGDIKNVGKVDGKDVEDPETIKTVNITAEKANTDQDNVVKPGDTFDYTIVLTNSGNVAGTAKVTDEVPEGLKVTGTNPTTAKVEGRKVDFGDVAVAPGTPVTLTISVEVEAGATGDIHNVGKVDGKDVEDPETIKTVNITAEKSNNEDDNKVKPGDTFDYTIVLTNSGNTTGSVTVTDDIPGALEITGTTPTATVTGNHIDFGDVTVAPGTPVTLTISVKVKDGATGDIKNVGKVDGKDVKDPETIKTVNITAEKSNNEDDNKVKPGDTFDYTIVLTNSGNTTGSVTVTDDIPDALEITGTTPTATVTGNHVDFGNVEVAPGTPVTLTISVKVKDGATGDIKNVGKVDGKDVEDPETIKTVNITAKKSNNDADNKVKPGDTFDYTIVLTNSGNTTGSVTVTDDIPDALEITGTTPTATVTGNHVDFGNVEVAPGTPVTLTISVKVKDGATGDIKNVGKVDGKDVEDPETIKTVNITAEKSNNEDDNKVKPGDTFDYTIVLTNSGNTTGSVTVTDDIPDALEITGTTPTATVTGNHVDFGNVEVAPGTPVTLTISVKVKTGATGDIKNVGKVDGKDVEDPETIKTVNITAEKSNNDADNKVKPGDTFDYSIVLTNNGNTKGSVTVTDDIPDALEITGTTPTPTATVTVTGNHVDFGDVEVAPGTPVTLTISVKVKATATGTFKNVALVDGKNTPDKEVTIENVTNITATKENNDTDGKVKAGDVVTYTIKLSNSGNVAGTTTVTDRLPSGVIYQGSSDNGVYSNTTGTVIWNNVNVPVGTNTKQLTVTVTIDKTAAGRIVNTAIVENEEINDKGLDLVKITATKSSNITSIAKVGQEVVYTITAINNGTIAGDATITDQVPSTLELKEATLTAAGEDTISKTDEGLVTWNVKGLKPGAENARVLTIKATIKDFTGTTENITNEVKVDNEKTSETTIEAGKPLITSTKTSEIISCPERNELTGNTVHEGDKIKYTITVRNTGAVEKAINVTDQIKDGLRYVDGTLTAEFAGKVVTGATVQNGVVKLENYTLTTGGTLTITFTVEVKALAANEYSKTIDANVAVVDGANVPDEGGYEVLKPIISSDKTSAIVACSKGVTTGTIVHENDQIKYTINVYNTGRTSGKVTVEDTIPEGLSYVAGSVTAKVDNTAISGVSVDTNGKLTLTNYSLAAGKTLVIEFTAKVNTLPAGVYGKTILTNVATVNGTTTEDNKGKYEVVKPNIEPSKSSAIVECSVNQTTGKIVHENDKIRYTITVENNGTDSDVVNVTDTIPAGLTYVRDSLSAKLNDNTEVEATISGRQIKVEAYTLAAGKTLTITFDATVDPLESGVYSKQIANNIAVVNGVNVPDNGGYEVQKPQIESSKVVDKQTAEYDEELTYTITAKNLSTTTSEVNISDQIPEGTEYVANSIKVNGTAVADANNYKDGKVVYTGSLSKQNETVTITFKVKVTEKAIGTVITNKANINNEEKQATTKVVKKVTVETESSKVTPIDLVLVLDVSGSMNDPVSTQNKTTKMQELRTAAQKLADKVFADETTSTISVITYSKSASDKGTYTYAQRNNLKSTISGLTANGGTNIYAALNAANTKVSALGTEREKVVVFLTDGSPTIPDYIRGVHSSDNADSGFTNNVKDEIVKQAKALKTLVGTKGKVYSIGLGLGKLSTENVRSASECTTTSLNVTKSFDTENHTFTITIANPTGSEITLEQVDASFSDISKLLTVENGEIRGSSKRKARWSNVKISANGSVTLTGTYEPYTYNTWNGGWVEVEREPSESSVSVDTGYEGVCITEEHQELFNGKPLYTVIKTADGKQYHGITEKDYANYLLSKISTEGIPMNVNSVETAFDKILHDISTIRNTYTVEEGTVIDIPETHNIISVVTVKIGDSSKGYTLDELKAGVNGLVYKEGEGFKWTITGDTLLTNKLSLEYKVNE